MEAKRSSFNLTKYVKVGPDRWQHCRVVRGKTGRIKQDLVLVGGRVERHPEGYYSLDWREGGRRRRRSLGKDADKAQQAHERQIAFAQAQAMGLAIAEEPLETGLTVQDACEDFLAEIRLQRAPKTFKQYRTALAYFREIAGKNPLSQVVRRTLLDYRAFLAEQKKLSPRTIWTKMIVVAQMLKAHGMAKMLRRGDWPRYVERVPQAYAAAELKRFFAACGPDDAILFQFFLGSGFREKEVQFLMWRDISLEDSWRGSRRSPNAASSRRPGKSGKSCCRATRSSAFARSKALRMPTAHGFSRPGPGA